MKGDTPRLTYRYKGCEINIYEIENVPYLRSRFYWTIDGTLESLRLFRSVYQAKESAERVVDSAAGGIKD
jgi:hypothetical protein